MPLWTMCRPHSSSATPPIRSRRTRLPMISTSGFESNGQATAKRQRINLFVPIVPRRSCKCGAKACRSLPASRRIERRKTAFQIGLEVLDILKPDMEPQRRSFRRPYGGGSIVGAVEWDRQALETAPGIAHAVQFQAVQEGIDGGLLLRFQHDAEQAGG